ncbi:MAG: hypothetical protein GY822_28540, partial [Deltaproteobacteria bacterium]|nr:hypothetical protein [Deltaproteobacteria bacterium]
MRKPITQTLALLTLSLGAGCQYNINIDGDRFSQEDILQCVDQCEDLSDEEQGICIEDCLDALE